MMDSAIHVYSGMEVTIRKIESEDSNIPPSVLLKIRDSDWNTCYVYMHEQQIAELAEHLNRYLKEQGIAREMEAVS